MTLNRRIFPPEWAPQSGVLLTWPHRGTDWNSNLAAVENVFGQLAREISHREFALIACYSEAHRAHVRAYLRKAAADLDQCRLFIAPSNDSWARDHGPLTVFDNQIPLLLDYVFNGWGGKFPAELDNEVTRHLAAQRAFGATAVQTIPFVLEGGSIDSDGGGTLLTTARCLLSPARNPGLGQNEIERHLRKELGVNRVLWLQHGALAGDDTDGHIDTLARFCDPATIAYVRCTDPRDAHYQQLRAMEHELVALRTTTGTPYRLVPLPWPKARHGAGGGRLPATYANFLIINEALLVPTYDDEADEAALSSLGACFPGRKTVGIDCRPLIAQNGSLHCVTMQFPAGVVPSVFNPDAGV